MFSVFGSLVDLDSPLCVMLEPPRTKELVAEMTKFVVVAKIAGLVCELF